MKSQQPALGAAIERWLAQLPDLTEDGRERLLRWAGNAAADPEPVLAPWMKAAGEDGEDDRRRAVVWVFNGCPQSGDVSPDALRILLAAAREGKSEEAASRVLHRLRDDSADEPQDIESVAAAITPIALASPHPEHVIRTVLRFALHPNMPSMSRSSWRGLASLTASECEANERTGAIEDEIRAQRREAGSLRRTAYWELLAGTGDGAPKTAAGRQWDSDRHERFDALLNVLESRDIDELIEACRGSLSEDELQSILGGVIGRLVQKRDARFSAEHRERLGRILGEHVARESHPIVHSTWRTVAHTDAARQFLANYRETGRVNWGMYTGLSMATTHLTEAQRTDWGVTLGDLCRESLRRGTLEYMPFRDWISYAPDDAERTLLQEIDLDDGTLTPPVLRILARGYQQLASRDRSDRSLTPEPLTARAQAAIARLTSLAARADEAGATATNALEILGVASQAPVLALGAEWRTTKSPAVLERFFQTYIQHLPEGAPFERWQQILGPAHVHEPDFLTYRAEDAGRVYELYLHLDRQGRLTSWQEGPR